MTYVPTPEHEEEIRKTVNGFVEDPYTPIMWDEHVSKQRSYGHKMARLLRSVYIAAMLKHGVWKEQG
jgi:hypothetical protein